MGFSAALPSILQQHHHPKIEKVFGLYAFNDSKVINESVASFCDEGIEENLTGGEVSNRASYPERKSFSLSLKKK